MVVDEKDLLILEQLTNDSRMPTKHIAETLDIPRVTVHSRIEKLKLEGVIKQFTIITDYAKLGLPVLAFIFIEYAHNDDSTQIDLANQIAAISNVSDVHLISGEWDMLVKMRGKNLEEIGRKVIEEIRPLKGVTKTVTCPSFVNVKNGL
ncbi:MAG: Lrp/AsnC family transcriptional regulator [Asgard group archaeon]|nr:Lrp/AsnC family transcriptional regulator [Asgard group archaeon]